LVTAARVTSGPTRGVAPRPRLAQVNWEPADYPTVTEDQVQRLVDAAFLTDPDGRIAVWNAAATELLGHPAESAVGGQCAALLEGVKMHGTPVCLHPCPMVQGLLPSRRASRTAAHPDMLVRRTDGQRINLSVIAMAVCFDGVPMLMHLLRNEPQSERDPLTGTLNRDAFTVRVLDEQNRALRTSSSLSLALIDVDGLKAINDAQGHSTGDRLLIAVADSLRAGRRADLVGRWGGDEFVALLPDATPMEGARRLRRTLDSLGRTVTIGGQPATFSAGVVQLEPHDPLTTVFAAADVALYRAKQAGRARVLIGRPMSGARHRQNGGATP
jgi:diguanylate cyclase (GGDEF)-like protein